MIKEKKNLKELTEKYIQAFFEDLDVLNIKKAQRYPKATEHVKDIETMISTLISKGYAYEENGSVYFRVKSFRSYGRLANKNFDDMIEGTLLLLLLQLIIINYYIFHHILRCWRFWSK